MKKYALSAVATSVIAMLSAPASAITLYDQDGKTFGISGNIRYALERTSQADDATTPANDEAEAAFTSTNRLRMAINASQKLDNGLTISAKYDMQRNNTSGTGTAWSNRDQWVKFSNEQHSFAIGTMLGAQYEMAGSLVDFTESGGTLGSDREEDYMLYQGTFNNLKVALGHSVDTRTLEEKQGTATTPPEADNTRTDLAVQYTMDAFSVGFGHSIERGQDHGVDMDGANLITFAYAADMWTAAFGYRTQGGDLSGTSVSQQNMELSFAYNLSESQVIEFNYLSETIGADGQKDDVSAQAIFGYVHKMGPLALIATYTMQMEDAIDTATGVVLPKDQQEQDSIFLAARYSF